MLSRLVPVVADISTSSLFTDEYYSTVRTDHSLYTPSSADQHMGYSHFLAVVTNAAMIAHVQGVAWTWVFLLLGRQRGGDELGRAVTPCWRGCVLKSFINMRVALMLPLSNTRGCVLLAGFQLPLPPGPLGGGAIPANKASPFG